MIIDTDVLKVNIVEYWKQKTQDRSAEFRAHSIRFAANELLTIAKVEELADMVGHKHCLLDGGVRQQAVEEIAKVSAFDSPNLKHLTHNEEFYAQKAEELRRKR